MCACVPSMFDRERLVPFSDSVPLKIRTIRILPRLILCVDLRVCVFFSVGGVFFTFILVIISGSNAVSNVPNRPFFGHFRQFVLFLLRLSYRS